MSAPVRSVPTPSQTIGPFFHHATAPLTSTVLASEGVEGVRIRVRGRVLDGEGQGVDDALVEIWQPDVRGQYARGTQDSEESAPAFRGFGRSDTVDGGRFEFVTVKPGRSPAGFGQRHGAPFISMRIFARGLLRPVLTRLYFEDEAEEDDPVLSGLDPERRRTLIASLDASTTPPSYRFDVRLQGANETLFFDL